MILLNANYRNWLIWEAKMNKQNKELESLRHDKILDFIEGNILKTLDYAELKITIDYKTVMCYHPMATMELGHDELKRYKELLKWESENAR